MNIKKITASLWLMALIVLSITIAGKKMASPEFKPNAYAIEAIDGKIDTVMELTAASSVASVAVSAIPGDTATPLAEKLADFSSYFLIVLCVLYLEKYLVTLSGYIVFTFLIPAALALLIAGLYLEKRAVKGMALRLILLGLTVSFIVPASVRVSDTVYITYQYSMKETIDTAENFSIELEDGSEEENAEENGIVSKIVTKVTSIGSAVLRKIKALITRFIEALAVMIVTSCLIPMVVMIILLWAVKVIMKVDAFALWEGCGLKKQMNILKRSKQTKAEDIISKPAYIKK